MDKVQVPQDRQDDEIMNSEVDKVGPALDYRWYPVRSRYESA